MLFLWIAALALALPAAARTRPHYGGTLSAETAADPWQKPGGAARRLVFDGLTRVSSSGQLRPALAASWKSEADDHRWQFQLRPGVHYHDGSPVTAATLAAALEKDCASACPWGAVRAFGSAQLVFTSDSAMPNLAALLAGDEFLIEHASSNGGVDGTGPFAVKSFTGNLLTLTANDEYWGGRPFVDAIELKTRRAVHDQWIDLEAGRADIVEVPAEELRQARQQHLVVVESRPVELLVLQAAPAALAGALRDPNQRRALSLAVDRGALSNVIFQKQGEVTASLLPNWVTGYSFLFPPDRDLNKAHELRGGAAPVPLALAVEGSRDALTLAAGRIALNLREAGFPTQPAGAGHPNADLTLRTLTLEQGQPADSLASLARALGNSQAVAAPGAEQQLKAERDLLQDGPAIPLLYLPRAYALGGRVRDLQLNFDGSWALDSVSLADNARPEATRSDAVRSDAVRPDAIRPEFVRLLAGQQRSSYGGAR